MNGPEKESKNNQKKGELPLTISDGQVIWGSDHNQ